MVPSKLLINSSNVNIPVLNTFVWRTFGLIVCPCYFQQAEDTGHSSQACVCVRVLQTGNCALQDVQHAFVNLPAHLLEARHRDTRFRMRSTSSSWSDDRRPQTSSEKSISPRHVWSPVGRLPPTGRLGSVYSERRRGAARSPTDVGPSSCWASRPPDHRGHSAPPPSRTAGSHWEKNNSLCSVQQRNGNFSCPLQLKCTENMSEWVRMWECKQETSRKFTASKWACLTNRM